MLATCGPDCCGCSAAVMYHAEQVGEQANGWRIMVNRCMLLPGVVLCCEGARTFASRRGPMNISYSRRESAPLEATTASGLTTLPRLLLILWALALTRTLGSALSTKSVPSFCTSAGSTLHPLHPPLGGTSQWSKLLLRACLSLPDRILSFYT